MNQTCKKCGEIVEERMLYYGVCPQCGYEICARCGGNNDVAMFKGEHTCKDCVDAYHAECSL